MFLNLLLLCFMQYVFSSERPERLLLNDPSLIMDRLTQLENTVMQQSATIQTQSAEIHQLQKALNSTVEMKPAFFAILGSTGSIGNSEILKFNVVKTNIGSGYDVVTGVFVVPKRGTYHFTSVVYTNLADDAVVQMNKNKALVVRGYSTGKTHATSHVMNVVLILEKGDHIYVQHRGAASDSILGDLHSSFSGFMISE